jgi:hypothetical protein
MIGHDYMIKNLYGPVVFTTSHTNVVVTNVICDYVLHDYKTSPMAKFLF